MNSEHPVLVVDDDPDDCLALRAVLERMGLAVVEAYSGEEALRRVLERDFAVILIDLMLPRMNGFETAALVRQRERSRNVPFIFLTGIDKDDFRYVPGYKSQSSVRSLRKPVSEEELRSSVLECLKERHAPPVG
jgi:CheY-like chemotaxis protein